MDPKSKNRREETLGRANEYLQQGVSVMFFPEGRRSEDGHLHRFNRGAFDLAVLKAHAVSLKREHPDHDDASVLLEPDIEYDHLIQVMDAMRSAEMAVDGLTEITRVALFTNLSIGDAP